MTKEEKRIAWRQYACAALAGVAADPEFEGDCCYFAQSCANEMIRIEERELGKDKEPDK